MPTCLPKRYTQAVPAYTILNQSACSAIPHLTDLIVVLCWGSTLLYRCADLNVLWGLTCLALRTRLRKLLEVRLYRMQVKQIRWDVCFTS